MARAFYKPANDLRKTIKNIPIPTEHVGMLRNIEWIISDMIELQIDRESTIFYTPLITENKALWKKVTKDLDAKLTKLCMRTNINFGALIEAYKHTIRQPDSLSIMELSNFEAPEIFRKAVMTNYFLYEMYTRIQSQMATLFQEMRRSFKKIRTARDLTEMVRFTVQAKELKLLLPIWADSVINYNSVENHELI